MTPDVYVPKSLLSLTFALQYNPNCPSPWLVRLPGKSALIDLKPYSRITAPDDRTGDFLGFGATFEDAATAAIAARPLTPTHVDVSPAPNNGSNAPDDLIRRINAIQACQVKSSDGWAFATKSGYTQAALDCARNILQVKPSHTLTPTPVADSQTPQANGNALAEAAMRAEIYAQIEAMPMREERMGGQRTQYIQRGEVLAHIQALPLTATPAQLLAEVVALYADLARVTADLHESQAFALALGDELRTRTAKLERECALAQSQVDRMLINSAQMHEKFDTLSEAAQALGAIPEGYCFCSKDRIGDDSKIHEPECRDLRTLLGDK